MCMSICVLINTIMNISYLKIGYISYIFFCCLFISSQQDAVFELISVCQNTAIWYMKHAAMIAGKDE